MTAVSGSPGAGSLGSADLSRVLPALRAVLPRDLVPIFDETFVRSGILYDEYIHRLTLDVFARSGLAEAARTPGTASELIARARLHPVQARVPVIWMLRTLASRGVLETGSIAEDASPSASMGVEARDSGAPAPLKPPLAGPSAPASMRSAASGTSDDPAAYRLVSPIPSLNPVQLLEAQRALDPSWIPAYTVACTAAADYPEFLAGRLSGEEILFSPSRLGLWFGYFTNQNGLYSVNNRIGAIAAETWLPGPGAAVLELGGGLGSAAEAFLERFRERGRLNDLRSYRFTELMPAFLRRAQRSLSERFGELGLLSFGRLDMDKPFAGQGVEPGSASVVYAVNTLHVAHDMAFTLAEIRTALAQGGRLILSECVKPSPVHSTYVEFIFNLMESFRSPLLDERYRPSGGFLTPGQWTIALESSGFRDVRFLPDIQRVHEQIPVFYVAAVGATRAD